MKATIHLLVVSAALISGCASTSTSVPPRAATSETLIGYVTSHVGAHARETYKVTTDGLFSPRVQISRTDDGFRGVVQQRMIDLRVTKGAVTGSVNQQPIDLHIDHRGGKLWVEGLYGGRSTGFFVSETPLHANLPCSQLQPWISISTEDLSDPSGCDVASVRVLEVMRAYLDESDAAALLAVMVLGGSSSLMPIHGPMASPHVVGSGNVQRTLPTQGGHHAPRSAAVPGPHVL